ncbi:MAG: hypothetical protein ACI8RD_009662 [Bacillariaceae sp.]|jgi:hypothetical protein
MKSLLTISATLLLPLVANLDSVTSFGLIAPLSTGTSTKISPSCSSTNTALFMGKEEDDLLRAARSSRSAGNDDNVVELQKPLGLVLNQDDAGNVYVETVAARGNAARTGKVRNIKTVNSGRNALCTIHT